MSGAVYTLMNKIFRDSKEPLYGRADSIMKLAPFTTSVLKEIISDHKADYTKDDLLALYTFTGGVPKYPASNCKSLDLCNRTPEIRL